MTEKPPAPSPIPDPIDASIGSRLRLRRLAMGFSQETLAKSLGITFQQIQKYERGANRIFASRLFHLARVLRVPVSYFFQGLSPQGETLSAGDASNAQDASAGENVHELLNKSDVLRLIQAYSRIKDPRVRRQIYSLVKAVGEQDHRANRLF